MTNARHVPVLLEQVTRVLLQGNPATRSSSRLFLDCTFGGGGYTRSLLGKSAPGVLGPPVIMACVENDATCRVVAMDRDPSCFLSHPVMPAGGVDPAGQHRDWQWQRAMLQQEPRRFFPILGRFSCLERLLRDHGFGDALFDGICFDLGVSSMQLDDDRRGFSYHADNAPLDMRMDVPANVSSHSLMNSDDEWSTASSSVSTSSSSSSSTSSWTTEQGHTAASLLNFASEHTLSHLIRTLGGEPRAGQVAKAIVEARRHAPFHSTGQLHRLIDATLPCPAYRRQRRHPSQKIFQALRMAVNDEMRELELGLRAASRQLKIHGNLIVVSFHSLEDGIVRRFMQPKQRSTDCTLKPVLPVLVPDAEEVARNPRSHSVLMRIARRIA